MIIRFAMLLVLMLLSGYAIYEVNTNAHYLLSITGYVVFVAIVSFAYYLVRYYRHTHRSA